jgi:hypothetical protein
MVAASDEHEAADERGTPTAEVERIRSARQFGWTERQCGRCNPARRYGSERNCRFAERGRKTFSRHRAGRRSHLPELRCACGVGLDQDEDHRRRCRSALRGMRSLETGAARRPGTQATNSGRIVSTAADRRGATRRSPVAGVAWRGGVRCRCTDRAPGRRGDHVRGQEERDTRCPFEAGDRSARPHGNSRRRRPAPSRRLSRSQHPVTPRGGGPVARGSSDRALMRPDAPVCPAGASPRAWRSPRCPCARNHG